MTQDVNFKGESGNLRVRAEELLRRRVTDGVDIAGLSPEDVQKYLHELQVHQIELEMQNDEMRKAQLALEDSRDKYLELYDYAPVAYFTLNAKGLVLETNLTALLLLEEGRESLVNKPFSRFVCAEDADSFHLHLNEVLKTGVKQTCQIKLLKKDGHPFHAQVESIAVWYPEGEPTLCRVAVSDISDRKEAEALLAMTHRLASLGEMASGVAHNFNNMLQIVMGNIELILMDLERGEFSEVKDGLKMVLLASKTGAEIVGRLQSFANIRCPVSRTESKVLDLSHVVNQAVELTRPWWEMRPCRAENSITFNLDANTGCLVRGREDDLFEVAVNLIKNAAEALVEGGDMTVRTKTEGDQAVLQVQDTGIGISKDDLGRVFDPFWSSKGLPKPGMGLAVGYGIVISHGGTIHVESELGKGSTFTVRLPLSDSVLEDMRPIAELPTLRNLTILAVDDNERVVEFLKTALEANHHRVLTALSGPEALGIFRDHQLDVVICDLGMPEMSGWEVGKKICEICRERSTAKTPFIMLTGWAGQILEKDKIIESGVQVVLAKPVGFTGLLTAIREAVRKSQKPGTGT
ncbi:MAG: ATP-binding protein [Pseudomonadota bacterium]